MLPLAPHTKRASAFGVPARSDWFVHNIFELNPKSHRDGVHPRSVYVCFRGTAEIQFNRAMSVHDPTWL